MRQLKARVLNLREIEVPGFRELVEEFCKVDTDAYKSGVGMDERHAILLDMVNTLAGFIKGEK